MSETYDLTVIGAGPGGYVAALRGAQLGLKVALVEKDQAMGGTCLLRGCIPSKALLHDAEIWSQVKKGGFIKGDLSFDWNVVLEHKRRAIQVNSKGVEYLLRNAKVTTYRGVGSIPAAGRVEVQGETERRSLASKAILIATGSEPRTLPGVPIDEERIVTSTGCLELKGVPKRLLVLGSGAIGVEFASVFARFGSEVTILELLPRIVPLEDEEVSAALAGHFKKQGMRILTGTTVTKAGVDGERVVVEAQAGDGATQSLEAEVLLVCVGRRPVTQGLGLEALGVKMERGFLVVDRNQQTSVPGLYAIGDCVPGAQLAHKASAEGVVAAESIAGVETVPVDHRLVPNATYCEPEIGSVGLSEAKARELGHDVKVGKFPFSANGRARIEHLAVGFVKIVADARYGEVLGVHIVGPHATELIAEAVAALRLEATAEDLARTIHAHPTVSEAVGEAAHAVLGHAIHV